MQRALRVLVGGLGLVALLCACGTLIAASDDPPGTTTPPPSGADGAVTGGDGDGDAQVDPTSDASVSCDATFCSDFDPPDQNTPPFGWEKATGIAFTLGGQPTSPPYALVLDDAQFYVSKSIATPGAVSWQFDLRVDESPGIGTDLTVFDISCSTGVVAKLKLDGVGALKLQISGASSIYVTLAQPTTVRLDIDSQGTAKVSLIPAPALTPLTVATTCPGDSRVARLGIIEPGTHATGTWKLELDHVRATY